MTRTLLLVVIAVVCLGTAAQATVTVEIVTPADDICLCEGMSPVLFAAIAHVDGVELYEPEVTYEWDFDDGSDPAEGAVAIHTFVESGQYTVQVTATVTGVGTGTDYRQATVYSWDDGWTSTLVWTPEGCDTVTNGTITSASGGHGEHGGLTAESHCYNEGNEQIGASAFSSGKWTFTGQAEWTMDNVPFSGYLEHIGKFEGSLEASCEDGDYAGASYSGYVEIGEETAFAPPGNLMDAPESMGGHPKTEHADPIGIWTYCFFYIPV